MLGRLLGRGDHAERRGISLSQLAAWKQQISASYSPVPVSTQQALTHAASSACVDVLATSVSTLPIDAVRTQGRSRIPVSPAPSLIAAPSAIVAPDVWMYQLVDSMCTDGNGFGLVTGVDSMARPTGIELLNPGIVADRRVIDGVPTALVDGTRHRLFPHGELWHVPGKYARAGSPFAESPVVRAAATIGAALVAREFGSRFFADGGHPGGIIKSSRELTKDEADAIKKAFVNATRGNREPAVIGAGLEYSPIMIDPNDSQFLGLMQFCIEEACRFWRVPPSMVYASTSGQNVTYANASQADLHYLKHSLEGLLVRIERALSALLTRPQFARFNRNAFLRADPQTRFDIYDKRLRNKTLSVNDVHALEDEPGVDDPDFDEPGIPGAPAGAPGAPTGGQQQ